MFYSDAAPTTGYHAEGELALHPRTGQEWYCTKSGNPGTWVEIGSAVTAATVAGTTDTLATADAGKVKRYSNAGAVTVTVPTNASDPIPVGTIIAVYSAGAGGVTIAAAGGVTIRNNASALVQYQEVSLRKDDTDEWVRSG